LHRDALLHLAQDVVAAGLRAAENHGKARALEPAPGLVREAQQRIDAGLAPPGKAQRRKAIGDLARMGIAEEEVVVVEMDGIHAMGAREKPEMLRRPRRMLHFLFAAEDGNHAAEIARIRTADRGL